MKRLITLFLVLTMLVTSLAAVTVSASADLSEDFVKTYVEQDSTKRADENLIKETPAGKDCYMLWSGADIGGRNCTSVDCAQAASVVDYDGNTRNMLQFVVSDKTPVPSGAINGLLFAKDEAARVYYAPSDIKDGDKLVVSIYVKTKDEGAKTRFNMGFIQNVADYEYNAYTDTYGKDGMEVTDEWKQFKGIITIPEGYTESLIPTNYCLTMGYPGNMSGTMEEMLVSNPYIAKAKAVDIKTTLSSKSVKPGETASVKTEVLNQLGTTEGVSQSVTYYVTNEDRTAVLTDSGITVAADGSITVADSAEDGKYGIVAVYDDSMVSGKIITVDSGKPANLEKDFERTYVAQSSSMRADDNLIKNTAGNEDCYMLWSGADIGGRNSGSFDIYQAGGVVDFDGKTRNILYIGGFSSQKVNTALGIEGALFAKDAAARTYYTPTDIKGGDKLLVSVYAKTKNAGTKTRFNMGFVNGGGYAYNAFTDTYGEDGMEVTDEWKRFTGIITIPDDYNVLIGTNYGITFGYPTTMTDNMEEMLVSNPFIARVKAIDIKSEIDSPVLMKGETAKVTTKILNQCDTTDGVSQEVTYYVTNADRTEVVSDAGITVSADGTVTAAEDAKSGVYYIVAVSNENKKMVKGVKLSVGSEFPDVDLTEDYYSDYAEQTSSARAPENLIKNTAGNEDCYLLWSGADIGGRNSASFDVLQAANVVDFDGKTRNILYFGAISNKTANPSAAIEGAFAAKDAAARTYYTPSDIKDGDKILVSVYVKTKNEGTKTRFNMGFIQNVADYEYNAYTDAYGMDGMEVTDQWKRFVGVINIPNGYESSLIPTNYCLTFGYPSTMKENLEEMLVSNLYVAKLGAKELVNAFADTDTSIEKGASKTIYTKLLNQAGTTDGFEQKFKYVVTNDERTEILTDSGITVTPGKTGEATVSVSSDAKDGSYYVIAISKTGEVMGQPVLIGTGLDPTVKELKYYVSNDGNDTNKGTIDAPFKTLDKAKAQIRKIKDKTIPITVYIRGGLYQLSKTFTLESQDSGSEEHPITYKAYNGEEVVLTTNDVYNFSDFNPLTGDMKDYLKDDVKDKIYVANAKDIGLDPIDVVPANATFAISAPMMMLDNQPMSLSRYPNSPVIEDWMKADAAKIDTSTNAKPELKVYDDELFKFTYRPEDFVYYGYIAYGWCANAFTASMDRDNNVINGTSGAFYGASADKGKPICVFNSFEALDEPGEWYYDKSSGKLYIYPFEGTNENSKLFVTTKASSAISVSGAKNINIEGIRMTTSKKYVLSLTDVENITINNCVVNNSVDYAVNVDGAYNVTIKNSVVNHTGNEAIYMYGGDLETLKPSGNRITNNVIHDTNKLQEFNIPAVNTRGVGIQIDHNEFYNIPLMAIAFALAGNDRTSVDTIIEYNDFHDCLQNGVDLGVIYGGRDMRALDNTIRYNYFHNNSCNYSAYGFSASAVFVDDYVSCTTVEHNIVGPGMSGVNTEAFKVNQGQGNVFNANLIIDLPSLFYQYDWGDEWTDYVNRLAREGTWGADAPTTLAKVWENETWTKRWPWIKEFHDGKGTRTNTTLSNNVMIYTNSDPHSVSWMHEFDDCYYIYRFGTPWAADEPALTGFPTNLIMTKKKGTDNRDLFVDYAGGNYNLKPDVLAKVPGFTNIDQSEIGLKSFEYEGKTLIPGDAKPTVSDVSVSGVPKKGKELKANFKFASPDGHKNGTTHANYYITDTADEDFYLNFKKVSDNTGTSEFTVTPECEGKYIRCKVTPVDENGATGESVWAEPLYIEPAGDVDKDALYELNDEAKTFYNGVEIGDGEGQYPKSEADLMKEALDKTAEVLSSQNATQYQIDEQYKALESAFKRFKKSANVSANVTRVNIKPFITAGEDSWQIMKNDVKYEFTGDTLHMHSGYGLAAYTGEKFKNTEFAFRYKQSSVNDDDWGGFAIGLADPSAMPWSGNSGVLVVCKPSQLELQFYDGVNSPSAADGTFVAKLGNYIENDKTYDITFGMYDVNGTTVRVVLTIDGETIFDEQRAISEFVSREGHFSAIAATNTEITLSGANVDKTALKAALDEAETILASAQAGTDYNQYSTSDIAKLKAAYDSAKAVYDDEKTAEHEVDRAAYALGDAIAAFRKTAVTTKNFTEDGSVDLNYYVGKSTFTVADGVKAEVKGADKALPEIDSTSSGISMNIPSGTKLSGSDWDGTFRLPATVSSPSGKAGGLKIGKVFALGGEKIIKSDGWIKLTLKGMKDEKLAYLADGGNYKTISDKSGTEPMYRESDGNDAVIYTKILTEIVTFTTGGSTVEEPETPVTPGGGNGSGTTKPSTVNKGGSTATGNGGFYSNDTTNPSISNPFTDMVNHWAAADVLAMNKAGIVSGVSDTLFDPDRNITRAEFAAIIARALKLTDKKADYKDVNDEWFAPYVGACSEAGIISGYDGMFRPNDNITRQEMAVIIVNAYSYLEKAGANGGIDKFTDKAKIADWAKAAVDTASSVGLISGMGDGTFAPEANATRAQAASIVKRLLDK